MQDVPAGRGGTMPHPVSAPNGATWADVASWARRLTDRLAADHAYQHVAVFVVDDAAEGLRLASQRWGAGDDLGQVVPGKWLVPLRGSVCGRVARTGQAALCADIRLDDDYRSFPGAISRSELAVPIVHRGRPIGVINLESPQVSAFGIEDLEELQAIAADAAADYPASGAGPGRNRA